MCAICRKPLAARCKVCEDSGEDRACQGIDHSAACFHTYHFECIHRWLRTRPVCPLCNNPWIAPQGLSLKQLAVAPWAHSQEKIVELVAQDLDPSIYTTLDCGLRLHYGSNIGPPFLPAQKQRLLAHTFGQYLEIAELDELLVLKRQIERAKKA